MPQNSISNIARARLFERQYPNDFKITTAQRLFCRLCKIEVDCSKKDTVTKHLKSKKHIQGKQEVNDVPSITQHMVSESVVDITTKCFLEADIPLHKLRQPAMKEFFAKLGHQAPSESACRRRVDSVAEDDFLKVKEVLKNQEIFIVIDGSNINGINYVNILAGDTSQPSKSFLVAVNALPLGVSIDHATIVRQVDDCLQNLEIKRDNFLLMLSDAASYMKKAGEVLEALYPNFVHVTCFSHMLHNSAMQVH